MKTTYISDKYFDCKFISVSYLQNGYVNKYFNE